jgi:hypothetical protein
MLTVNDDFINQIAWNDTNPTHNYSIEVLNGAEQTVKYGNTLQLNVQVKDNGSVLSPTPSISYETSNGSVCTVDENGLVLATNDSGNAIVTVKLSSDTNISTSIKIISASSQVANNTYTLVGNMQTDTQISINQTKTYTANKFNNDLVVDGQFTFSIIGNVPSSAYILTTINNNQCSLKCNASPYTVTLRAIDNNNGQYIDKIILFVNLI